MKITRFTEKTTVLHLYVMNELFGDTYVSLFLVETKMYFHKKKFLAAKTNLIVEEKFIHKNGSSDIDLKLQLQ